MNEQKENQFLLLFRGSNWCDNLSPEELQTAMDRAKTWFQDLTEKGIVRGGAPLLPSGKVITGKSKRSVSDGPFAESKEAIGGYLMIAVDNIDLAVSIAKSMPALDHGTEIEIRAVAEECPLNVRARELELASA